MEVGRHDELLRKGGRRAVPPSSGPPTGSDAGRAMHRPPVISVPPGDAARPRTGTRAFHYASTRTVPLGHIASRLGGRVAFELTSDARRMPVIGIKITSLSGGSVHAPPTLTEGGLYLDHRDLAAIETGAVVPELAEIVARIR